MDLSAAGHQPMHDPETGAVIVFNGEIYNHLRLRLKWGSSFGAWNSASDTETVLKGYLRNGPSVLDQLKGMFAFAIFDPRDGSVFFARDRFGMKPLYVTQNASGFWAASETRALPSGPFRNPSRGGVAEWLRWGASPESCLLFDEIASFPAGCWMQVGAAMEQTIGQYWPKPTLVPTGFREPQIHVRRLLEQSVEEHLLADVEVASFLSGGVDSSIITALAARKSKNIAAFSVGFGSTEFDETAIAQAVARRYGIEHHCITLNEDEALASVVEALARMDLPSVDAINTYIVAKAAAKSGIKAALSGLGADELFGGYPSFSDVPKLQSFSRIAPVIGPFLGRLGTWGRRLAELPGRDAAELALWRRRMFTDAMLIEAGLPVPSRKAGPEQNLPDDFARISWAELTHYMRHMLLRDADQMSMSVGLELRLPFLDHELVEYVLHLPARIKSRGSRPKGLLIESCRDLMPPAVYQRKKMGFGLPMDEWMRGPLAGLVREGIEQLVGCELISAAFASGLQGSFARRAVHWTRPWSLAVLGQHLKRLAAEDANAAKRVRFPEQDGKWDEARRVR